MGLYRRQEAMNLNAEVIAAQREALGNKYLEIKNSWKHPPRETLRNARSCAEEGHPTLDSQFGHCIAAWFETGNTYLWTPLLPRYYLHLVPALYYISHISRVSSRYIVT